MELQEAYQIHKCLLEGTFGCEKIVFPFELSKSNIGEYKTVGASNPTSLHDLKAIVKTWRNRLPVIADDLVHWSDIFSWRQQHYQLIVKYHEQHRDSTMATTKIGICRCRTSVIYLIFHRLAVVLLIFFWIIQRYFLSKTVMMVMVFF